MTFKELGVIPEILSALEEKGYSKPTPIQAQSIPVLLKGKDLMGAAQTGTGKTAAFTIPILQQIYQSKQQGEPKGKIKPKALIVTPTRELALQILENLVVYAKNLRVYSMTVYGGVNQNTQVKKYNRGVDVIVATPGRLIDLIGQRLIDISTIEYFVLDEVDQMLDMGFINDIKRILQVIPKKRQSLFFSATMPPAIVKLADGILGDPHKITIKSKQATADRVEQAVYFVVTKDKQNLLKEILETTPFANALIFTRTKYGADKVARFVGRNQLKAAAIHGNKSQNQRQNTLKSFKKGKLHVLVATDIAARGLDISDLSLVINYDLPNVPETYVHRIGRTGRADASGLAISICVPDQRPWFEDIEKLIKCEIPVKSHSFESTEAMQSVAKAAVNVKNKKSQNQKAVVKTKGNTGSKKKSKPDFHRKTKQLINGLEDNRRSNNRKKPKKKRWYK